MIEQLVLRVAREALLLVLIMSGPPIVVSMVVGLVISLFQATTQIQEQTLTFVPKLVAVFLTLAIMGPLIFAQLVRFTNTVLSYIPNLPQ